MYPECLTLTEILMKEKKMVGLVTKVVMLNGG